MVRVSDRDTAYRVFRALELGRFVYCLQEFIPHACKDIRAFVVGERVVAAMTRRSQGWKTNIANGAKGEKAILDEALCAMSIQATKVLGAEYAGVDILPVEGGGYRFIEVNGIPAWRGLYAAAGINAADALVDYLLSGAS